MSCINPTYCISTGFEPYDGDYNVAGTYNSEDYFTGGTYFIFYDNTDNKWCLSTSLGGTCLQFGPTNTSSSCPDLDSSFFTLGSCPTTTTTTTSPCDVFDFEAIFDCIIPITTTTTTVPPTTTTTTTVLPDPCSGVSISASISAYTTTTTTVAPTTTTTTTILYPCNFEGVAQFNIFDQYMRCGNSKVFKDCVTGLNFYTSELVESPFGNLPIQDYVYKATINDVSVCVIFLGLVDNISGMDTVILEEEIGPVENGSCELCVPDPPPPPTPIPCDCYLLAGGPVPGTSYRYINCDSEEAFIFVQRGTTGYTCSQIIPQVVSGGGNVLLNSGSCETVNCIATPPPTPVPCEVLEYHVSVSAPTGGLYFTYTDCDGNVYTGGPLDPNDITFENVCSATVPISDPNNPIGALQIGPTGQECL